VRQTLSKDVITNTYQGRWDDIIGGFTISFHSEQPKGKSPNEWLIEAVQKAQEFFDAQAQGNA
jgi:hypothetical protein